VEFASVVDAVRCALDIQRGMTERNGEVPQEKQIQFRIGINVGDIIIEDQDIFGDADAWHWSSWVASYRGDSDTAIVHSARAMRLSPFDPLIGVMQAASAFAHVIACRYDEASIWAEKAMRELPQVAIPARVAAASYALSGRTEQANQAMVRLRQIDPTLRVSNIKERIPPLRQNDMTRYVEALRAAGLPD
jgi:tetratricopeptide (TPR) repeat protein